MSLRTFCTIFLFFSACALPLYFTLAVGFFAVVWFRGYWELVPIYFLNDALYGVPLERFHGVPFVMTLLAVALVLVAHIVRTRAFDTARQKNFYA